MRRYVYETMHPAIYHGHNKQPPYFEGWYYKLISADERTRFAVIPGIFKGQAGGDHAFVQILDGMNGRASYHEYPAEAFHADEERFDVRVGPNRFTRDFISLNIDDDQRLARGQLHFSGGTGWPVSVLEPGVMGWYAWLPFMECYHGVLSFDHHIAGSLQMDDETLNFTDGRGYMEKDWGQAFPSAYIWFQTNHFEHEHTSLFGSAALIPSMGRVWRGFLMGFWHQNKLYKLTTYTGATIERLDLTDDHVYLTIADKRFRIETVAERKSGGLLKAPVRTEMHKRVDETMQSTVDVRVSTRAGETLFEGCGRNAALEVHGDLETLINTT
jgi:tocopherol cyclase